MPKYWKCLNSLSISVSLGKLLSAVKSAICLRERYPDHPKTLAALLKLHAKWLAMSDEDKLNACGKDARILAVISSEIESLDCTSAAAKLKDN